MVAGIVRLFDIPMVQHIDPANNEDLEFADHAGYVRIFDDPSFDADRLSFIERARELVGKRNRHYSTWGWKDPLVIYYLKNLLEELRSPHFVFVFRDPASVAQREIIDRELGVETAPDHLLRVVDVYSRMAEFLAQDQHPALLVSYERALRQPLATVRSLADFLGLRVSAERRARGAGYVRPDRHVADITGF
mgnify:CR=1 FL=1